MNIHEESVKDKIKKKISYQKKNIIYILKNYLFTLNTIYVHEDVLNLE